MASKTLLMLVNCLNAQKFAYRIYACAMSSSVGAGTDIEGE